MKYKVYYQENKIIKSIILESNNLSNINKHINYPKNVILIKEDIKYDFSFFYNDEEKIEMFYEIKIMLDSDLEFEYIIDILLKSDFNTKNMKILQTIKQSIKDGTNIYEDLGVFKNYIGSGLVFFKIANENSNLKECINALYLTLLKQKNIRNSIKNLLTYPLILLLSIFFTIYILFVYVVPKFENIYLQFGDNLPYSTKILLDIKYLISNYYFGIIILFIIFLMMIKIFYEQYKYYIDKVVLNNIPIFSKLYKNILFYKLFLSLSLQINSKESFYNALLNTTEMFNNNYLKSKLQYILKDIKNGKSIYESFEKTDTFDMFTLRLLHTAQLSNKLEEVLKSIVNIYDSNIKSNIKKFKNYFEPFLIFIISSIVLWLVLAIMSPIWDLGSVIK
jgi:general secretion pathway protein F